MEVVKHRANKKINEQSCLSARLSNYFQTLLKKKKKKSYFTCLGLFGLFLDYVFFFFLIITQCLCVMHTEDGK